MVEVKTKSRYPNLQTVFMEEKFIEKNNGEILLLKIHITIFKGDKSNE